MAKKHFDEYYRSIYSQYVGLKKTLDDLSQDALNNMIEPERLEQLKRTIQPVKSSYDMLTYVKYLLDMPARKQKRAKYDRQNKKVIDRTTPYTADNLRKTNSEYIRNIKL